MSLLKRVNKYHWYFIGLIVLLSIPVLLPFIRDGFFQSDDGEWMIIRFSSFYHAFRDGQFPVRWLGRLNNGYGYPVANFLYPGFMYLGIPIKALGFGFVETIKIILATSLISSALFTYAWLRHRFNMWSAFVGSVVYLYVPYHLYDIYVRGSVGEIVALAVVPFVFWQIERKSFFWQSVGIAVLILAHNTLAAMFLPVIAVYKLLYALEKRQRLVRTVWNYLPVLLGLGLSAFFWIPALYDLQFTIFSQTTVSAWREYFAGTTLLGIFPLVVTGFFASLLVGVFVLRKNVIRLVREHTTFLYLFFIVQLIVIFLSSSMSTFVWEVLPLSFIQFPFRVLALSIMATAFLTAYGVSLMREKTHAYTVGIVCIGMVMLSAIQYMQPKTYFFKDEGMYATNEDTTTVKNEYMPRWVKKVPTQHPSEKLTGKHVVVTSSEIKNHRYQFVVDVKQDTIATIHTVYFPEWKVTLDGKELPINYQENGLLEFALPAGSYILVASFIETPVRLFANGISVVSLVIIGGMLVIRRKHGKK